MPAAAPQGDAGARQECQQLQRHGLFLYDEALSVEAGVKQQQAYASLNCLTHTLNQGLHQLLNKIRDVPIDKRAVVLEHIRVFAQVVEMLMAKLRAGLLQAGRLKAEDREVR